MRSQSYVGYRSDCLGCPGRDKLSEKTCVEAVSGKSPRNGICAAQMASDCQEKYHGLNFDDISCPSVRIASSMRCEKANIESISSVSKECSDKLKYECQRVNPCFQTCLEKNTHDRKACRFFAYSDRLSATPNCKYFYDKNSSEFKCKEWEIFRLACPGYENNLEPCFGEPSSLEAPGPAPGIVVFAVIPASVFVATVVIAIVLLLWFRGKRRNQVAISDTGAVKYSVTQQPETNREGSPTTSEYSPSVEAKQPEKNHEGSPTTSEYNPSLEGKQHCWSVDSKFREPVCRTLEESHTMQQPNDTLLNPSDVTLSLEPPIGRGGGGQIFQGIYGDIRVALKENCNYRKRMEIGSLANEAGILCKLRHPRIVTYYGLWIQPASSRMFLVMELCPNGDLSSTINNGNHDSNKLHSWASQIAAAIDYLHTRTPPIAHRDIKLANVLVDKYGDAKLTDFGLATITSQNSVTKDIGTIAYMPPEVLKITEESLPNPDPALEADRLAQQRLAGLRWDVYSLAIAYSHLFSGRQPFSTLNYEQIYLLVVKSDGRPQLPPVVPEEVARFISSMWVKDPATRPPMSQVRSFFAPKLPELLSPSSSFDHQGNASVISSEPITNSTVYSHATALGPREDALLLGGADRAPVLQDEISAVNLRDIRSALQSNPVIVEQVEELNEDIASDRSTSVNRDSDRPVHLPLPNMNGLLPVPVQRDLPTSTVSAASSFPQPQPAPSDISYGRDATAKNAISDSQGDRHASSACSAVTAFQHQNANNNFSFERDATAASAISYGRDATGNSAISFERDATAASAISLGRDVTAASAISLGRDATAASAISLGRDATAASAISLGRDVTADSAISAGRDATPDSAISSGRDVTSDSAISSGRDVTPDSAISSGRDVTPDSAISSGRDVTAASAISSGRDVTSDSAISFGRDVTADSAV